MLNWLRQMNATRAMERELEQTQEELRSVEAELVVSAGKLKGLKAIPNPNPQELGRMEGEVAALSRHAIAARRWIAGLEQQLRK